MASEQTGASTSGVVRQGLRSCVGSHQIRRFYRDRDILGRLATSKHCPIRALRGALDGAYYVQRTRQLNRSS